MNTRLLAILWLLALITGRYGCHALLGFLLPPRIERARRNLLHRRNAKSLLKTATRLRGVLIKIGQFLSTRVDVLPKAFTEELARLQDRVPPLEFSAIHRQVSAEFGQDLEKIYPQFAPIPLAAASLGQVHEATLRNGQRVAVKVQYPGVRDIVQTDLKALRLATRMLQWWVPDIRFDLLHDEFCYMLSRELDYTQEGRYAEAFRRNFATDSRVVVPQVFWEYTTPRVLTLEFIEGIKITEVDTLKAKGVDLPALSKLVVEAYMAQLLEHRLFHGDPHPGNLFVQPHPEGPRLAFVDFGIMQPMEPPLYQAVKGGMQAIIERDHPGIIRYMKDLGVVVRTAHAREVEHMVSHFMREYRDRPPRELRELTVEDLGRDIHELLQAYPYLQLPNHFIIMGRTIGMLSGLNALLDPNLNLIELAAPSVRTFLKKEDELTDTVVHKVLALGHALIRLPQMLASHLEALQRGEVKSQLSLDELVPFWEQLYRLALRGILALLGILSLALWIWLRRQGDPEWAGLLGFVAALVGFLLVISLLRSRSQA